MFRKRGQSTLEYALVIAVAVAALLAVNAYMKKGVQGKLRESTDQIGRQFDPQKFSNSWQTESSGLTTTTEQRDLATGATTSTIKTSETITRGQHDEWGNAPK